MPLFRSLSTGLADERMNNRVALELYYCVAAIVDFVKTT